MLQNAAYKMSYDKCIQLSSSLYLEWCHLEHPNCWKNFGVTERYIIFNDFTINLEWIKWDFKLKKSRAGNSRCLHVGLHWSSLEFSRWQHRFLSTITCWLVWLPNHLADSLFLGLQCSWVTHSKNPVIHLSLRNGSVFLIDQALNAGPSVPWRDVPCTNMRQWTKTAAIYWTMTLNWSRHWGWGCMFLWLLHIKVSPNNIHLIGPNCSNKLFLLVLSPEWGHWHCNQILAPITRERNCSSVTPEPNKICFAEPLIETNGHCTGKQPFSFTTLAIKFWLKACIKFQSQDGQSGWILSAAISHVD